jgi:hypothetical protein
VQLQTSSQVSLWYRYSAKWPGRRSKFEDGGYGPSVLSAYKIKSSADVFRARIFERKSVVTLQAIVLGDYSQPIQWAIEIVGLRLDMPP